MKIGTERQEQSSVMHEGACSTGPIQNRSGLRTASAESRDSAGASARAAAEIPGGNAPDPPPKTVLFVSGDEYLRTTMRAYMEHVGYQVRCCADAARVPEMFFHGAGADLLLMDLHLLGATGLRLAAELTGFAPDLPVIAICAPAQDMRGFSGVTPQSWRFLRKPVVLPELLGLIRNALERRQDRRQSAKPALPREKSPASARRRLSRSEPEIAVPEMKAQGSIR
jgi:DNA-binding NtrC family response regulator